MSFILAHTEGEPINLLFVMIPVSLCMVVGWFATKRSRND